MDRKVRVIYLNGDSYMYMSTGKKTSDFLSEKLNEQVIDKSIPGSSNDRIFRTSLRDLITLKDQYKNITAVIGLSFIYRQSIWDPIGQADKWKNQNDGEFASYQLFLGENWFSELLNSKYVNTCPAHVKNYLKESAILFNPEAEITKLLHQIELFSTWCEHNNIKYFVFSCPPQEDKVDVNAPFIKPFYDSITKKKSILDLFNFSFVNYCLSEGFVGFDSDRYGKLGRHVEAAHQQFAEYLIENYINEI